MPGVLLASESSTVQGNGCVLLLKEWPLFEYIFFKCSKEEEKKPRSLRKRIRIPRPQEDGNASTESSQSHWSARIPADLELGGEGSPGDCQSKQAFHYWRETFQLAQTYRPLFLKETRERKGGLEVRLPLGGIWSR